MVKRLLEDEDVFYYDSSGFCRSVRKEFGNGQIPTPHEKDLERVREFYNRLVASNCFKKEILND
jgi:hypothetical protein